LKPEQLWIKALLPHTFTGDPEKSLMKQSEFIKVRATDLLQKITQMVFGINFWLFFGFVFFLPILQNGIWYSPQTERLLLISKDIFKNPFLEQPWNQWLLSSFLGPVLGYITSANRSLLYFSVMHLMILIIFFPLLVFIVRRRYGDFIARTVLIL
jgi:hypothetical protein